MARAFIVCVDYADILELTLPGTLRHFRPEDIHIITAPNDKAVRIAARHGFNVHITNAFYADGAIFNKWKALEEALDKFLRYGWIVLLDADIVLPDLPHLFPSNTEAGFRVDPEGLLTPRRRMLPFLPRSVEEIPPEDEWERYPIHANLGEWAGYCQLFNAKCSVLRERGTPWHETDWKHAGGADSFFQALWPIGRRYRPVWDCLHLGPAGENWMGRVTPYTDGSVPAEAQERAAALRQVWHDRRYPSPGEPRFASEKIRPVPQPPQEGT
jgi:hypothetical protein